MKNEVKSYLFVDGSNLYAGQYEAFGPEKILDFSQFVSQIETIHNTHFEKIFVYASFSPRNNKPSRHQIEYLTNEALFFRSVRAHKAVNFFKGYRSVDGKEKLVDVQLAVDIVDKAHLQEYSHLYLCSGDADYSHALEIANRLKRKITIVSLSTRIPNRLSYLYKTTILKTTGKIPKLNPHQHIKLVALDIKKSLISIKNPGKQAPRAS